MTFNEIYFHNCNGCFEVALQMDITMKNGQIKIWREKWIEQSDTKLKNEIKYKKQRENKLNKQTHH